MAFVAGLVLNLPGVWYLDALTEIAKAMPSTASALLQLLVFNVIMFALVEVPIVAYAVNPKGAASLVERASNWGHDTLAESRDRPGDSSSAFGWS